MSLWRLIAKEISHRKLTFVLACLAVAVAAGVLVAEVTLLGAHDRAVEAIAEAQEAGTRTRAAEMKDDYRKLMKLFGYNVLILPADEDLAALLATGRTTATMPEAYVERLAGSKIMVVRHLLPSLQRQVTWPERDVPIVLMGIRGEAPLPHRRPREPMEQAVPKGAMVVGATIGDRLGLVPGAQATLMGRRFTVSEVRPPRGTEDDVTVWIPLATAQELLEAEGRISAILALSCLCMGDDELSAIRREVTRILPDVQVMQLTREAAIRREARVRAGVYADANVEATVAGRVAQREVREGLAAWAVPLVVLGAAVWVGVMALVNVRERTVEIGLLRALGLRGKQIAGVFLARALLVGAVGGVVGIAAGAAAGVAWGMRETGASAAVLLQPVLLVVVFVAAPALAAVASLVPAMLAAQEDPAPILAEE